MKTRKLVGLILALSVVASLCVAVGHVASAPPQGRPTAEECEQAKLKASAAQASAAAATQQARVAEEVAYQASQEARTGENRVRGAETVAEGARRRFAEATEAFQRGYRLAPDPVAAERDYWERIAALDQAREQAEPARTRAADRRRDAEMARTYANQLLAAAESLKKDAEDLCARRQPIE